MDGCETRTPSNSLSKYKVRPSPPRRWTYSAFLQKRRQYNERPNGPISYEAPLFLLREAARRNVLNPGTQFPRRIFFSGRETRGETSAEPRSRYDTGIRRRFIITGFSKESSPADNTLFLTARKFPSPHRRPRSWKIPEKTPRPGKPCRTTAGCDHWILGGASALRNASAFPHYGDATRNDGGLVFGINSQSDLSLSQNADVILRQDCERCFLFNPLIMKRHLTTQMFDTSRSNGVRIITYFFFLEKRQNQSSLDSIF